MKIETIAIHAGHHVDSATRSIAPPIYLTTTFERDQNGEYPAGFKYTRADNPNRRMLESCLTQLEGGRAAMAFSSGSAATMSVFQALKPGDHVIAPDDVYHGTSHMLKSIMKDWQLDFSFVDTTDIESIKSAIKSNTRMIFIETPSIHCSRSLISNRLRIWLMITMPLQSVTIRGLPPFYNDLLN